MRLIILLTILSFFKVTAAVYAQQISLNVKDAPIEKVLDEIKKQSGYSLITKDNLLENANKVTLSLRNVSLRQALDACFRNQSFSYELVGKTIVVKAKATNREDIQKEVPTIPIKGKVIDSDGQPLIGATINVKGTNQSTSTDVNGEYELDKVPVNGVLVITFIGLKTQEVDVKGRNYILTKLLAANDQLDAVQIIGYGTTTERLSTGNVASVKADVIENQPVTNPLDALEGRISGLQITQQSGLPGSSVTVQIRGRSSIAASNNPLYIVDGVPFTSDPVETYDSGSPLNSINPSDIESISVLKDADATAIYGSRAANGVILITTKKGKAGKTKFEANVNSGISGISRKSTPLSTAQYLQVRKDAFANSGITPNATNAPDLVSWNANTDFNWQNWFMGKTANYTDATASFSGGTEQTTFLLSGTYHNEGTVQFGDNNFERASTHLSLDHRSIDKKFHLVFSAFYTASNNYQQGSLDMLSVVTAIPNFPVYNSDGSYNWTLPNYVAMATAYNKSQTNNLNSNLTLDYLLLPGLKIKASLGYGRISNQQDNVYPSTYNDPATGTLGRSIFSDRYIQTLLFEPQVSYDKQILKGTLNLLAGSTIQQNHTDGISLDVQGYTSNLLLENPGFGTSVTPYGSDINYKYNSIFGRATYNWEDKYIINGTFRRDGSSRFGPGKKFGNFGSIGGAWIFSNEELLKNRATWLSFGKVRGSWGTTGNDGIGDYQYLSTYTNTLNYGNLLAISPTRVANSNYSWEVDKKLEFALDLGFLKDKVLFSAAWYQNRSSNELVSYQLPSITGFSSYIANLPAIVQNTGWEFDLNTKNIDKNNFHWSTSLTVTIPRNKLLAFPGISSSSYADKYVIGQPLNIVQGYHFLGVDPQTGLAMFKDVNGDGALTSTSSYNNQDGDYVIEGTTDPKWYGGLMNSFRYKNWQLDVFLQYVRQNGYNLYSTPDAAYLGSIGDGGWTPFLNYWKQPGDIVSIPKPSVITEASQFDYLSSDAGFGNASFFRLKNVALFYNLPESIAKRVGIYNLKIFVKGQNLLTWTKYMGYDPELAGNISLNVPTLKTFTAGLQCSL